LRAGFLAAACFLGGCVIIWDDPVDEPDDGYTAPDSVVTKPSLDVRLIGDWRTVYKDDDSSRIEITTLTASGEMIIGGYLKVGGFWIESWESVGAWRASNDTLYELYEEYGEAGIDTLPYSIFGNRVTLSICDKKTCDTTVAEKVDAAAVRNGLAGKIYGQDNALFASSAYTDLMWRLEGEPNEILDFDMMYFCNGERYFGEGWYYDDYYLLYSDGYDWYDPIWYVDGSALFLILASGGEIEKTAELRYEVTGSGSAARLSVIRIFPDGAPGGEDVWLPAEFGGYGDGSLYKSRRGKKFSQKRRGAFAASWMPKAAAGRR